MGSNLLFFATSGKYGLWEGWDMWESLLERLMPVGVGNYLIIPPHIHRTHFSDCASRPVGAVSENFPPGYITPRTSTTPEGDYLFWHFSRIPLRICLPLVHTALTPIYPHLSSSEGPGGKVTHIYSPLQLLLHSHAGRRANSSVFPGHLS